MVGGISAGGNIAAVVSHLYRDDRVSPPLTGSYLSIPLIMNEETVPDNYKHIYLSREQNKNAPILDAKSIEAIQSE